MSSTKCSKVILGNIFSKTHYYYLDAIVDWSNSKQLTDEGHDIARTFL